MRCLSSSDTVKMPVMGGATFAPDVEACILHEGGGGGGSALRLPPVVFVGRRAQRAAPNNARLTPVPHRRGYDMEALEQRQQTALKRRAFMAKHIRKGLCGVSGMILHSPDPLGRSDGGLGDEEESVLRTLRHIGVKSSLRRAPGLTFAEVAEHAAAIPGGSTMGITVHNQTGFHSPGDILAMRPLTVVTLEDLDLDDRTAHETVAAMCGTRRKTTIEEVLQERGFASHHVLMADERSKQQRRYEAQAAAFGLTMPPANTAATAVQATAVQSLPLIAEAVVPQTTTPAAGADTATSRHTAAPLQVTFEALPSSSRSGTTASIDPRLAEAGSSNQPIHLSPVDPSPSRLHSEPEHLHEGVAGTGSNGSPLLLPLEALERKRRTDERRRRGKLFSRTLATRLADLDFNFIPADHAPVLPSATSAVEQRGLLDRNHPALKPPRAVEADYRRVTMRDDVDAPLHSEVPISIALRMEHEAVTAGKGKGGTAAVMVGPVAGAEAMLRNVFELAGRTRTTSRSNMLSERVSPPRSPHETTSPPLGPAAEASSIKKPPRPSWKRQAAAAAASLRHTVPAPGPGLSPIISSPVAASASTSAPLSSLALWYRGAHPISHQLPPPSQGSTMGRVGVVSPPMTSGSVGNFSAASSSYTTTPAARSLMTPAIVMHADAAPAAPSSGVAFPRTTLASVLGMA